MITTGWRKSSYSASNSHCVEVRNDRDAVRVRDSKNHGPAIAVSPDSWGAFVGRLRQYW